MHSFLKSKTVSILVFLIGMRGVDAAPVESGRKASEALSMEEIVAQALSENPELLVAEAAVAGARGDRRATGQWKNPEIAAEYGEKRVSDGFGDLTAKGNSQHYSIQQTFEFPGKASLRKAIADHNIQLAELSLEQMRLGVAARARTLTIQWLAAEKEAVSARDVADRSDTLVKMLSKRAAAGVQSLLDQRIIEASMVNIHTMAREAEEKKENARIALNVLRGKGANDPLVVKTPLSPPSSMGDWNFLYGRIQETNLDLKVKERESSRAEKSLSHARIGAAPDIAIGPFFSKENVPEQERVMGLGMSLPLPLWDNNRGQIDTAKAGVAAAHAQYSQAQRNAERELAQEYTSYRLAMEQLVKTPPKHLEGLGEAAELADRHYRLGGISVQTYIEMQDQYLGAVQGILGAFREAHEHLFKIQVLTNDRALWEAVHEPVHKGDIP